MKQFLVLSLFVCCAAFFEAHARSIGLSLDGGGFYKICSGDEFDYNGLTINSFRKIKGHMESYPIGKFALEETDYYKLFDKKEASQLEEIRSTYHHHLIELYSQSYLNDPNYKLTNVMYQKFSALQRNLTSFRGNGKNPVVADKILKTQNKQIELGKSLTISLNNHKSDIPDIYGLLGLAELLDLLKPHLYYLRLPFPGDAKMAFPNESDFDIIKKHIYKFDRFVPIRKSRLFNEWKEDFGDLQFNLIFPFEQKHSQYLNDTVPCAKTKDLPLFFLLQDRVEN